MQGKLQQGRRKQIESGGPISFGPPHFNSMKLKWGVTKDKWGPQKRLICR